MAGALTAVAGPSQAATAPRWRITTVLPNNSFVNGLAATGTSDAWAAGTMCADTACDHSALLVRRWNGKAWTVISVPKAYRNSGGGLGASIGGFGVSVTATSASSAWILNPDLTTTATTSSTIVLHWTGKNWGAATKLPAAVFAAVAPAAKDAWAFGAGSLSASLSAYAAHYNGKKWSPVRVPMAGFAASATSASDIWVIGIPAKATKPGLTADIMNFNGKTWRTTPTPSLGLSSSQGALPTGIAAISATNVWAGGEILNTSSTTTNPFVRPFLLHWNGRKWAVIKVPYTGMEMQGSLAQDGHGGIWMSIMPTGNGSGLPVAYLVHYVNGAWTRVAVPALRGEITFPGTLAWIPGTRSVWGAGTEIPAGPNLTASPSVIYKYGA
jgi:hypothetical protein